MTVLPETHEAVGQLEAGAALSAFQLPTRKPGTAVTVWIVDFRLADPQYPFVVGENLVGDVVAVGEGVTDVKPGDKVLSFSFVPENYGKASQEYALLSKWVVGKLPDNISPEEGVTVSDNLVTAYYSLFDQLGLPVPPALPAIIPPEGADSPVLIWGAGGSAGQYSVQLLSLAGYKSIFAIASSRHHDYLRSLGATHTFDYNSPNVTDEILAAAGGPIKHVLDAVGDEENSLKPISKIAGGKLAFLLPVRVGGAGAVQGVKRTTDLPFAEGVQLIPIATRFYDKNSHLKTDLQPHIIPDLLRRGLVKPNRYREVQGANLLERVSTAVDLLRRGAVSGERLVFRVAKD
ncbi:hypothetical protein EIP91_002306 [Steccherinum ochraceum]|uniref:Enoyl reductase (ER) domain-containing protein n=1 Tax=Steccherinum ochraceum TaxID=92696 RepID=A0A4R0RKT5_9APHY|nr:hypothetical protein EIP91_002306 [Steccherinum ochraceum]